jgi:SWIM zinc finger
MNLSLETARNLAPDDNTLQRAEQLASPKKWILAERNDRVLWGESRGSGSDPYRAIVDLNGPAYKCSCPVKRFPCKHTLALLLMAADGNNQNFATNNPPPAYVTEWLDARDRRNAAKIAPKTEEQIQKSEATKDKTRTDRLELMTDGIQDLQNRLLDIIRGGIAALENTPPSYWNEFAARMVDAKVGGVSRRIKSWASLKERYPENWYEQLLSEIGSLYLFTKAFQKFEILPENLQDDILIQAGMTVKKEDLFAQQGVTDDWFVLGQIETDEEDNLTSRRAWLIGRESGKIALVLDFAFGNIGFQTAWINGSAYRAEVVFYPAAFPLRVAVKTIEPTSVFSQIVGFQNFTQFLNAYSTAVAQNPWLETYPVLLAQVIPVFYEKRFYLIDTEQKQLALVVDKNDEKCWQLMALSGGKPIAVFCEWLNGKLYPLSIFSEGRFITL